MLALLLVACGPEQKPVETPSAPDAAPDDTSSADTDDTARVDTGETDETHEPHDPGPPPTAGEPFVVSACGYDVSPSLALVPDRDGDGVEELLAFADAATEVGGTWLVPSTAPTAPFWDQPLRWPITPAEGVRVLPDLDRDGVAELFAYVDATTATQLLPDGSLGTTWGDMPSRFLPWHDVDGDGRDELLVGAPALTAADATVRGSLAVVAAPGVDPTTWTTRTTMSEDLDGLGETLVLTTLDQDGDGWPEVVVTDALHGYLLSSAAIDAGASFAEATMVTFPDMGGLTPVALGDADAGGVEDLAFQSEWGPGFVQLFRGEAPDAAISFGNEDIWSAGIGPDGAGGLAVWALSGGASAYDLGSVLAGAPTRLTTGWYTEMPQRITASAGVLWVTGAALADARWTTRGVAYRLDPAVAGAVLAQVDGGGPGYGGEVTGYGLDDIDGAGPIEWWQLEDGKFQWAPLTPGATITVCDATSSAQPDWKVAAPGDDLDGDGIPEVAWWNEPDIMGLWSAADGEVADARYDGGLAQLGCDLTGDGVSELQLWRAFQGWIVDGAAWARGDTAHTLLGELDSFAVCVGDLNGDDVDEVADVLLDVSVYDGASVGAGAPTALSRIEGPTVGRVQRLGDVDGDGLGDLAFSSFGNDTGFYGVCIALGAELLGSPVLAVSDLTYCWESPDWYRAADVDGDGVNEVIFGAGEGLAAWSPATGVTEVVWTPEDDTRDEPLLDVVEDAFGPGRAAIVLGPDPIVVYALGE